MHFEIQIGRHVGRIAWRLLNRHVIAIYYKLVCRNIPTCFYGVKRYCNPPLQSPVFSWNIVPIYYIGKILSSAIHPPAWYRTCRFNSLEAILPTRVGLIASRLYCRRVGLIASKLFCRRVGLIACRGPRGY